jgi:hypothetical protein
MRLEYTKGYRATRPGRKRAPQHLGQPVLRITVGNAIATGCLNCQSPFDCQFAIYRPSAPCQPYAMQPQSLPLRTEQRSTHSHESLSGLIERVTFFNEENG